MNFYRNNYFFKKNPIKMNNFSTKISIILLEILTTAIFKNKNGF